MTSPKPATIRYYFDADVLRLARLLAQERSDITYTGDPGAEVKKRIRPPSPITTPQTPDEEWIPVIAARRWLIITRDRHIHEKPAELGRYASTERRWSTSPDGTPDRHGHSSRW